MKKAGWSLGLFQHELRSLFGEILDWMLTPLLLLWPVSLALTWLVAQGIANKPFDRSLEYNVQALAQLVTVRHGKVGFNLPQPARELLRADDSDLVHYQVLGARGEYLSGELAESDRFGQQALAGLFAYPSERFFVVMNQQQIFHGRLLRYRIVVVTGGNRHGRLFIVRQKLFRRR